MTMTPRMLAALCFVISFILAITTSTAVSLVFACLGIAFSEQEY